MLVSKNWLQDFFADELPSAEAIAEALTFGAFEIEGIEQKGNDWVIDVDVLPNRSSDCLSHRGIAREISVLMNLNLKQDPLTKEVPTLEPKTEKLSVAVENARHCSFYSAALIEGVKVGPSPEWLSERLEALGQKSINNVVDATNYIMLHLGAPLHAFDADKLQGKIGVRNATKGEKVTILGGEEKELTEDMTVITDAVADTPIAIGGVKGGISAELTDGTSNIILEAARFDPVVTRKTAHALNLRTDASKRFENDVPIEVPQYALETVAEFILEIAGGTLVGYAHTDAVRRNVYKLGTSTEEVNKKLGTNLSTGDMQRVLGALRFEYVEVDDPMAHVLEIAKKCEGAAYAYGASVSYHAPKTFDCSSFIAYVFAQAGIAIPRTAIDQFVFGETINESDLKPGDIIFSVSDPEKRKEMPFTLVADGSQNSHFGPMEESQEFLPGTEVAGGVSHNGIYLGDGKVIHAAQEKGVVIESYKESSAFEHIVGFKRMADADDKRFVIDVPFERTDLRIPMDLVEEIGRVYGYRNIEGAILPALDIPPSVNAKHLYSEKIREALSAHGVTELLTYSLRDNGEVALANSLAADKDHMRMNLSDAIAEKLDENERHLPLLGREDIRIFEIGNVFTKEREYVSLAIGVRVSGKKKRAERTKEVLDKIQKAVEDALGTTLEMTHESEEVREFDISKLINTDSAAENGYPTLPFIADGVSFTPISTFPFVLRDIAVWVPTEVAYEAVAELITKNAGDLLSHKDLFDTFEKDGRVSYAFHLVFQSHEKTLSDDEVNTHMSAIETVLKEKGWEVR